MRYLNVTLSKNVTPLQLCHVTFVWHKVTMTVKCWKHMAVRNLSQTHNITRLYSGARIRATDGMSLKPLPVWVQVGLQSSVPFSLFSVRSILFCSLFGNCSLSVDIVLWCSMVFVMMFGIFLFTQFTDVFRSVSINSKEILFLDFEITLEANTRDSSPSLVSLSQPQSRSLLSAYNSLLIKIIPTYYHRQANLHPWTHKCHLETSSSQKSWE